MSVHLRAVAEGSTKDQQLAAEAGSERVKCLPF
jgi:hypothetical protein